MPLNQEHKVIQACSNGIMRVQHVTKWCTELRQTPMIMTTPVTAPQHIKDRSEQLIFKIP